jgi:hypothetical protein
MKLVLLPHPNHGFLNSLARAVVEVTQALPSGGGLIKPGSDALVSVPVLMWPEGFRGEPSARNWRT